MSVSRRSPYEILGVSPHAAADEVKAAHRRAAKRHHPDNGGDPDAFADVTAAYDLLGDPERRAAFDISGAWPTDATEAHPFADVLPHISNLAIGVLMSDFDHVRGDVVAEMRRVIDQKTKEHRTQAAMAKKLAAELRTHIHRAQRKTAGDNTLAGLLEAKAVEFERTEEQVAKAVAVNERMKLFLADYGWVTDAFVRWDLAMFSNTSSS